jgi:hypothetical protein
MWIIFIVCCFYHIYRNVNYDFLTVLSENLRYCLLVVAVQPCGWCNVDTRAVLFAASCHRFRAHYMSVVCLLSLAHILAEMISQNHVDVQALV